jgi:DNA-binding SARP family transcriptional activator
VKTSGVKTSGLATSGLATSKPVVGLLGRLHVRVDGSDVAPRGLGGRLLAMLAVEPESGCDDEVLIDRLWLGVPPRNASFSLRNQVVAIRRLLGADAIVRTNGGYLLDHARCRTDVDHFDELLEQARTAFAGGRTRLAVEQLETALELVRGPVLADVRHESWAVRHVEAVEERIHLAEELWAAVRLRDGEIARELPRLRAAAEAQPQREVRWQQLIEAATAGGRRAEALRAAQDARRALARFGLDAGPGILAAEHAALESRTMLDVQPKGVPRLLAWRSGPFVERDRELEVLSSGRRVCVVLGDPGTGKTRLLAEYADRVRRDGATVVYVRADRTADEPRFVSSLASELVAVADRSEVSGELAMLLAPDPEVSVRIDPALKSAEVRSALARLVTDLAIGGSLVVLADDVHRLESDDWSMLGHLMDTAPSEVQFVISAQHPDADTVRMEWSNQFRLAETATVVLGPLARSTVDMLVAEHIAAGAADDGVAAEVWAVSEGNPLVVMEAIDEYVRTGRCEPGSQRLAPVLASALSDLGDEARRLLVALAVIDRPVDAAIAANAAGLDGAAVPATVAELRHRHILEDGDHDRLQVRADGYLSIARASVGRAEQARVRRRLVDDPAVRTHEPALLFGALLDLSPIAAADAGLLDETFVRVAGDLLAAGALTAAVEAAQRYLAAAGTGHSGAPSVRAHLVAATMLLSTTAAAADGRALLDVVVERARTLDDAALLADALLARGPVDTGGSRARRTADEAEHLIHRMREDDIPRRVQLSTWAAHHLFNLGDRDRATQLLDEASVLASSSSDPTWRGLVLGVIAQGEQSALGSPATAKRTHADLERWANLTGALSAEGASRMTAAGIAFGDGTLDDVARAGRGIAVLSIVLPRPDLCWLPHAIDAAIELARGERDTAEAAIAHAVDVGNELGVSAAGATAASQRLLLMLLDGSLGSVAALLEPTVDPQRARADMMAVYGLACTHIDEMSAARQVAATLGSRDRLLASAGVAWPLVAMAAAELAWAVSDADLAAKLWAELRGWSGWGLSTYGLAYLGAADTWLGVAAATLGRDRAAQELLRAGAAQDDRRGAVVWRDRALTLAAQIPG